MDPLREGSRIVSDSQRRSAELQEQYVRARNPNAISAVEYRSAGAYVADMYLARLGDDAATQRQEIYNRVASHQTTTDNPGLMPETIVGPLVNFVDESRPLVGVLGPVDLGSGAWSYARVTQHTQVGKQAGEKTELASRKMTISKTPLGADTYGGYVNISRQDINRTSPGILDMVINANLAGQYAIQTEAAAAAPCSPLPPPSARSSRSTPPPWPSPRRSGGAAGAVFAATKGQGRTVVAVQPGPVGHHRPDLPRREPDQCVQHRLQRADRAGTAGRHLRPDDHHERRPGQRHHPGVLHRSGQGL